MATTISALQDFPTFASALRETRLPGATDGRFLRKVYTLSRRKAYLETEGIQSIHTAAEKLRPKISQWKPVLAALQRAKTSLVESQGRCEEMYPDPVYWSDLFRPARNSLLKISRSIQTTRQRSIDQLHPRSLKTAESQKWEPLSPQYDYLLDRVGWKPVEAWFLEQLDDLIARHFSQSKRKPSASERHRLIQATFAAAFSHHKEIAAIKVAIKRRERRKRRAIVQ